MKLRNICTIAHVDHGKTTLVDHLLRQSGTFQAHETVEERVMDKDDIERERGITIMAKNAAFSLADTKVNIVDTPGHADFGGEVERIMGMVDGAILLVDAAEGPLPQTRFVLQKAIKKGLRVILCINKVDRPEVQNSDLIHTTVDKVFDLFVELGASDEQADFPIIYACAREGWCTREADEIPQLINGEKRGSLRPLFDLILSLPQPTVLNQAEAQMMVANIGYSEYVGAMCLGKLLSGKIVKNQTIYRHGVNAAGAPVRDKFQAAHLYSFKGLEQVEVDSLEAGDIGWISGCNHYEIGDTIVSGAEMSPMERIKVEAPTLRILFSINTSPFSGKEGKAIQSRELRTRLINEVRSNPALKLEDADQADQFYLLGRGELQFAILIERMRREGLEFMVGKPNVLFTRDTNGALQEPQEKITLDLPETYSGDVTRLFQMRKGRLLAYENLEMAGDPRVRLIFEIPTRGLLGTHSHYLTATRGMGLISSELMGYTEFQGDIAHRSGGAIISDRAGKSTAYALESVQDRGQLFIGEGIDMYEGMIIGEAAKDNDLNVNACRPKKLTNIRTTSSDGIVMLNGVRKMSLEACIEWIDEDEWIEVTPQNVRIRKKVLASNMRSVKREDRVKHD